MDREGVEWLDWALGRELGCWTQQAGFRGAWVGGERLLENMVFHMEHWL